MTWAQYVATGSGALAFRLDIAALPTQFVGLASQVAAASFGTQARTRGLKMAGQKLRERADVINAKIEAGGMRPVIVDVDNLPTSYLGKVGHPTATTWLRSNLTASATTVDVSSTTDFVASNGYLWIDSECISYTGVSGGNQFTGCTRGVFNTLAQAHYIADGASLRYPAVTNQPITLDGQRARLYAYGELDSPTGDGTLIWTGVVSSDPRYDGTAWSIGVDSLARLLNQKMGTAGSSSGTTRGIYYPANAPFSITFYYGALGFWDSEVADSATITFPALTTDTAFFENNASFCDYLNDKIAADATISGWLGTIRAVPDGDSGWHMELTTDSGTPRAIRPVVGADRFGVPKAQLDQLEAFPRERATGVIVDSVSVSTQYVIPQVPGFGVVPRCVFVADTDASYFPGLAAVFAAFPDGRLYTGGAIAPPAGTRGVILSGPGWDRDYIRQPYTISSGRIDITVSADMRRAARSSVPPGTGVRQFLGPATLEYVVIHAEHCGVGDFIYALTTAAPTDLNIGAGPDLRTADIDYTSFARWASGDGTGPWLNLLHFAGLPKHTLGEIISAECQANGQFMRIDPITGITATKIKSPIASEASTATIPNILAKSLPKYEHSARGLVNTVVISTGYDPAEDEWTGADFIVRDVESFGRSPHARTIDIKRLTVPNYDYATMSASDAVGVASRIFGLYGGSYAEVTVDVPLTFYAVEVGGVVSLTAPNIPNTDGTIGISSRAGIVVGREHDLTGGLLTLTIVISDTSSTGYAPAAQIATETNTSGNIWDVTLANTEAPTGTTSVDWFAVGDAIRVWKFDNATPATQTGDITGISGSTITITLDGAATLGTGDWILEYDAASAWTTNPDPPFLFLATSGGRVSLPTSLPAWVFSP